MGGGGVSLRLRQAIMLNDIALVQRLLKTNPDRITNPDFDDKSNTSLHLAAGNGLSEIVEYLISLGHDNLKSASEDIYSTLVVNQGISLNADGQTPLHLAASNLHAPVVELLCQNYPATIDRPDKLGATPLLLAAKAQPRTANPKLGWKPSTRAMEDTTVLELLLGYGADVTWQDAAGNTVLHNACAFGNLKALRVLIQAGADPTKPNLAGWQPKYYSLTKQAENYFASLVAEAEKLRAHEMRAMEDRNAKAVGSVRLVSHDDDDESEESNSGTSEQYYEA